jgi:Ala-tRNA(Pro) deacylase
MQNAICASAVGSRWLSALIMSDSVFERVEQLLAQHGVAFDVLRHRPVYTSQEAAEVRGTPLSSGAKALVCKADERFVMFVIPADRKLASKEVRRARGWRKLRFADREEVEQRTGLAPGSIPPFGSLFGLPTLCDRRLGQNDTINFNAGDHAISVSMRYADYVRVENPELGTFAC